MKTIKLRNKVMSNPPSRANRNATVNSGQVAPSQRINRKLLGVMVGIFGTVGVIALVTSFASISPNAKANEAENYVSEQDTSVGTDANASGGSYLQFDATNVGGTSCPQPANTPGGSDGKGGCFPGAHNTGYKNAPDCQGVTRTNFSGTIQSNQTIMCKDFPGGAWFGSQSTSVSNVTCYGCRFYGTAVEDALVVLFGDNITFDYSSFEPGVSAPPVPYNQSYQYGIHAEGGWGSHIGKLTVTNSDLWGFGNAIDIAGSTQSKPHVFRNNYIHDAADDGGSYHTDGIGSLSGTATGSYVVVDHNTIEAVGNTSGLAFQAGSYSNFTIKDNLLGGFGYTVVVWAPAPNTMFTGNTFSTRLPVLFGPLYPQTFWTSNGSVWKCNKWAVPSGAAYGNAAHDGWYWLPNSTGSIMTSDSGSVSQTDYLGNSACP